MKKLLALLLAVLVFCTLFAGCTRTETYLVSGSLEDEDDTQDVTDKTEVVTGADGKTRVVTVTRRSRSTAQTTAEKTLYSKFTGKGTRTRPDGEKALTFTPVADAGADYDVKGNVSIAINTGRPTDYEAMFDVLIELYPNINFNFEYWMNTNGEDNELGYLSRTMATGTTADIIWDGTSCLAMSIQNGWVYPITDLVAKDPEASNFSDNLKNDYTFCGELWAAPHQATFNTMCFNMNLMEKLDLELPDLEWSLEDMQELLRESANGFSKGLCVGMEDLFEVDDIATFYYANSSSANANYGDHGYNYATKHHNAEPYVKALTLFRSWRVGYNGAEGWYAGTQQTEAGNLLTQKIGASSYGACWENGKALMEFANTTWVAEGSLGINLPFEMVQWTAPTTKGNMMYHVDHCFISSNVKKENLEAVFQALRFMTYSTNGNLARLTMYEDSQKGKYSLNCKVFYPTSTSKAVVDKFDKLSVTNEVDMYMVKNIPNSRRIDTFKLVPWFKDSQSWLQQAINNMTDGLDQGDGLREAVEVANKKADDYWADFETKTKKYIAKYK